MAHAEHFSSYQGQLRHPALPLVVLHQRYDDGEDTGTFRHEDFYALYVVQGGRGLHVIDGHPYPVVRGDVYMTPPGTTHCYHDYRHLHAEAYCFQAQLFSPDELDALRSLAGFWRLFVAPGIARETVRDHYRLHLPPERLREVERMIGEIDAEMARTDATAPLLVRGLLFRLLVYVARASGSRDVRGRTEMTVAETADPAARTADYGGGLATVLRVCEERIAEPLSVPQLAALMFLSPSHFAEVFSRHVGMPPGAYIRQIRLQRAQTLLRTTQLSATEIAQATGFGDPARLSRAFRAAFDLTPTAYRRRFQGEIPG